MDDRVDYPRILANGNQAGGWLPVSPAEVMEEVLTAILQDDVPKVGDLIRKVPELVTGLVSEPRLYEDRIYHWIYANDTALHLASAGYRVEIVELLLAAGADPGASQNHRRSGPLHYASDGFLESPVWDPKRQVTTIEVLLRAGAGLNSQDKNGATPLHRAVRTRCAEAVDYLLNAGADYLKRNLSGSTPFHLAVQQTGRGGSGSDIATTNQRTIIESFLARGVNTGIRDGNGKTVLDCARSEWVKGLLAGAPA